ncbi:MAG: FG-GAP-like repeat-containing protein [Chryseosolibacter sp.]
MKVPHHLIRLYVKTSRRYKKLISKLHREKESTYQRKTFLLELKKVLKTLRHLQAHLKVAVATGTVVLLLNSNNAQAQTTIQDPLGPFVRQSRLTNPLREPLFTNESIITVVDFDKDSDDDVVLGEYGQYGGELRYFENRTAQGTPLYVELEGAANPFADIHAETHDVAPAFADIDMDGDMDLILGQTGWPVIPPSYYSYSRGIEYYRNDAGTFTKQTGPWDPGIKQGNPFDGILLGTEITPVFVDFDHDGDQDLIAGSYVCSGTYPDYIENYVHYYVNDGSGNFTASTLTIDSTPSYYYSDAVYPALADLDEDGDYDLVIGNYYDGYLRYYKQVSPGNFIEETDDWDPVAKTGNPLSGFSVGRNASPAFVDFDHDGKVDLFVADELGMWETKYSDNIINYYKNSGSAVFAEKDDFENPFDGVFVKTDAAPVLMDLDGDNDLDALIGNKYYNSYYDWNTLKYVTINSYLTRYQNQDGVFTRMTGNTNPFDTLEVYGNFVPQFADVDGDGDQDLISGNRDGNIVFFRNDDGIYKDATASGPFVDINGSWGSGARLVDLDNDGDLDLVLTEAYGAMRYFQNTGSAQTPAYTELLEAENPLHTAGLHTLGTAIPNFTDLDHDGDLDLSFNGINPLNQEEPAMLYMENTGTPENPVFETPAIIVFSQMNPYAKIALADYDGDGDLDAFAGIGDGSINYLENQNQKVNTSLPETVVRYDSDGPPVVIEPDLALADPDNDAIVQATVNIEDHQAGETLAFTPQTGINGTFDAGTGVLTFRGKATTEEYQALLRTVTFEVGPSGGRKQPSKKSIIAKTISFAVFDQDFTDPNIASKSLEIFVNDPPAVNTHAVNITFAGSATVDLKQLITDPNGAADLDLTTLKIIQQPASGASTSIDANGILTIDYNTLDYTGTETLTLEVCDLDGACAQNIVTMTVTNTPPVIAPEPVSTPAGSARTINLMNITSDVDNNLDPNAFTIVDIPASGANATIVVVSPTEVNLVLDYKDITYQGTDQLTIRACDRAGACRENVLSIEVDVVSKIVVYNAVAPNSPGDNRFMRIAGLPPQNKVSIFNRWGDKVFDVENYQNDPAANAFRGLNNNGNALPSGTYYYTIEVPDQKMVAGYLTLKQ